MHATLLFAPGTDARSPHLAIPSLAAYLRGAGVRTTLRDVELDGVLWLLDPANVARAVDACRGRFDRIAESERADLRVLGNVDYGIEPARCDVGDVDVMRPDLVAISILNLQQVVVAELRMVIDWLLGRGALRVDASVAEPAAR
jgi:hypothetical protein